MTHKPIIPMGAITGRPTRDELRAYLDSFYNAGIDQFLIYPRSGLEVEYMGAEWLEICRHIIEYCAEHNMAVWLYDEYNWPSGKCKGKVIKTNPDFASKKLVAFTDRNFCGIENPDAPGQEYFWTEMSIPLYADLLNSDAVDCFINLTHEVYYSHFGQYFGTTIKGLFSDEPSFMYAGFQPVHGSLMELPYYKGLKEDYRNNTGHELINDLESYLKGDPPENMWYNFYSLLGRRFCEVYMGKIRDWCVSHNILFTGHLMAEWTPSRAIKASGRPIDAMRAFSMPGLDEIISKSHFENIEWGTFKLLESAMNGPRTEALAELFALGPSDMSLAKMREIIYIAAVHGVNHFVTAVSALDVRGNVEKSLYYNPFASTQPWFKYMPQINESASVAASLTRKKSTARIALRYPQKLYCEKWSHKSDPELEVDCIELIKALIDAQWEFRIIGDDEVADVNYQSILELNDKGAIEEISKTSFNNIPEILAFLEQKLTRRACLRFTDGLLVEQVLLKSYDDGTVCVVNTSHEYLRGVGLGEETFDMPPRDIYVSSEPHIIRTKNVLNLNKKLFFVDIKRINSMRCIFPTGRELKIEVENDVEVKLGLRQYSGFAEVMLDGKVINACNACNDLPDGLKQLYRESDSFTLSRGCHILRLTSDIKDFPYLPLAFMFGHFGLGKDNIIRPLSVSASLAETYFSNNLKEYVGTVVLKMEDVDTNDYDTVAFEYKGLAVELFVNGESLGPRLWSSFEWELPEDLRKSNVEIELHVSTSVGPLFGDYPKHLDKAETLLQDYWPGNKDL